MFGQKRRCDRKICTHSTVLLLCDSSIGEVIYRKAAKRATTAPSPPRATVFRLAAPGSVPVAVGGRVPVWVPFAGALVVDGVPDVVAAPVSVDGGAEVVAAPVSVSVVEAASEEVAGAEVLVSGAPVGMLRVTPASAQRD